VTEAIDRRSRCPHVAAMRIFLEEFILSQRSL
jgi:hypothetical protein